MPNSNPFRIAIPSSSFFGDVAYSTDVAWVLRKKRDYETNLNLDV
jgi:hypothetical protein